jgi:hypothetical protein
VINSIQPGKEFTVALLFRIRQRLTQQSDTLREKLAVCHTRDTPGLTGLGAALWFERKMRESKQNAMATSVHTRKRPGLHGAHNRRQRFENCDALAEHMVKSRVPAPKVTLSLAVAATVVAI